MKVKLSDSNLLTTIQLLGIIFNEQSNEKKTEVEDDADFYFKEPCNTDEMQIDRLYQCL